MRTVLLLFSLCFAISMNAQEITIKNKNTKEAIPFVAISFGEDNGFYTDADGKFSLEAIDTDTFTVYSIGYHSKELNINEISTKIIYLEENSEVLATIHLKQKKSKYKRHRVKAKRNNGSFLNGHRMLMGNEIALFIPNPSDTSEEVFLDNIEIPIINRTMEDELLIGKVQTTKKHPFSSLFTINFYTNKNGTPDKKLDYENIPLIITEKSNLVKLDLSKYQINIPAEGVFIGFSIMGRTDKHGRLVIEKSYVERETARGIVKIATVLKPYLPVVHSEKKHLTYYRSSFREQKDWKPFYKHNMPKDGEIHNISLGYELRVYD